VRLIAALLLALMGSVVRADRIELADGSGYRMWLRSRPIPVIPALVDDQAIGSEAEGLAVLRAVHPVWQRVYDTQGEWIWYVGAVEGEGEFVWPMRQRLLLVRPDGTRVPCEEILASSGPALPTPLRGASLIRIYPGGVRMTYAEITVTYPSGRKVCAIYCAFPRAIALAGTRLEIAPDARAEVKAME
jgi:hypothetical protein